MSNQTNGLFNSHELTGIGINLFYFLFGFPSNLLSVIVCCKSLYERMFYSSRVRKNARDLNRQELNRRLIEQRDNNYTPRQDSLANGKIAKRLSEYQINLDRLKHDAKPNPHQLCFELYLIEISLCDLIILGYTQTEWTLLILSRYNIIDEIYMEPVLISGFMCRFIIAMNRITILMHNWLVASLALTRCYAIYNPLDSTTQFSSKFYLRLNVCVFTLLIVVFTALNLFGVSLLTYNEPPTSSLNQSSAFLPPCRISEKVYEKFQHIDVYINIMLGIIGYSLPCFITLLINILLLLKISKMRLFKRESEDTIETTRSFSLNEINGLNESSKSRHVKSRRKHQFLKTSTSLLGISFAYLICYIPYSLVFLLMSLDKIPQNRDVIFAVSSLRLLNHTINFYIYFLTGKKFRQDLKRLFGFN
nr:G protein-coupled receptor [Proales similis]